MNCEFDKSVVDGVALCRWSSTLCLCARYHFATVGYGRLHHIWYSESASLFFTHRRRWVSGDGDWLAVTFFRGHRDCGHFRRKLPDLPYLVSSHALCIRCELNHEYTQVEAGWMDEGEGRNEGYLAIGGR